MYHDVLIYGLGASFTVSSSASAAIWTVDSPILKGYQIFHNFVRPHEALDGDTPADQCGIRVEGANKWLTLIQNASREEC